MRTLLRNEIVKCDEIIIEDDTQIINYILKQEKPFRFMIYNVTEEEYQFLKKSTDYNEIIPFDSGKPIIGYAPRKGDEYRSSGGLKFQSEKKDFYGCFSFEKDKIIYCPCAPKFTEERDAFVYNCNVGNKYYTTLSMDEIFKEVLDWPLKFYIDTGRYKKGKTIRESGTYFLQLSKDEMLLCATNLKVGKKVFDDHLEKDCFVSQEEDEKKYKKALLNKNA